MYINNISVNTRHNRPSVLSRTALLAYFLNDGQYTDPYEISGVSIFKASDNWYPSSVIGSDGQISSDASGLVLMHFHNQSAGTGAGFSGEADYSGDATASGIYRLKQGVYAVVLDTTVTGSNFNLSGDTSITNTLSATGDYIDVWTVRRVAGSDLDTVINTFTLSEDRFMTITEPLMFRVATKLSNRYITLGSIEDLKFTNEITIENTNIDKSISNLFKDSLVMNPAIEIYKENTDRNLPSRVTVSGLTDTSSLCQVTSDNTVLFKLDTTTLATHPQLLSGNLGSLTGTYVARIKFQVLDQTFFSNYFGFIIR
jgi:hypothetical protein